MSNDSAPILDLDPAKLGEIVIRLGAASAMAHHSTVRSTVRDYLSPNCPELEYVRDLFMKKTPEIADRWYGGEFEAVCLATSTLGTRYGVRGDG